MPVLIVSSAAGIAVNCVVSIDTSAGLRFTRHSSLIIQFGTLLGLYIGNLNDAQVQSTLSILCLTTASISRDDQPVGLPGHIAKFKFYRQRAALIATVDLKIAEFF
jgi:hypothetical protein